MMNKERKTMRDALIERIYELMGHDKKVFFVSADFGAPSLDKLRKDFPGRFATVGIAEQNLITVSTGLALEGYTVFAYAIAAFLSMRAFEQIRLNLALSCQNRPVNVNLIGVGSGVSYDISGPTHHCYEDITLMSVLPNMIIFSPSDWTLARECGDFCLKVNKPKYIRFDSKPLPRIYMDGGKVDLGQGMMELRKGQEICLISTGYMTHKALKIADDLGKEKIALGVVDVWRLKPFNEDDLVDILKQYKEVITLEEGFINKGGLDSSVAMLLRKNNLALPLHNFGITDKYVFDVGNREYLHSLHGCDEESIKKVIRLQKNAHKLPNNSSHRVSLRLNLQS